jgi:hypothetical protein
MMIKRNIAVLFSCLLLSVFILSIHPLPVEAQTSNLIFSDDFDGAAIDSGKWEATSNVNGGVGGAILVSGGSVYLSSSGTSFPYVTSRTDPFPVNSDFTVDVSISYTSFAACGSGFWVSKEQYTVTKENGTADILHVWGDTTYGGVVVLLGERIAVTFSLLHADNFRLQYTNETYFLFMNDNLLGSVNSQLRPHFIGFGHPPAFYVPFPVSNPWTSFKINSVTVFGEELLPSPSPNPTPTETTPPTTDNDTTVDFEINGNITRSQMSNITMTSNKTTDTTDISFTVTGENGTTGFCNMTIPLSLLPDGLAPAIYIDGVLAADQGYTQDSSNYYVWFTTHFSTHQITINFTKAPSNPEQSGLVTIYGIIIAAAIIATATALLFTVTKRSRKKESLT